MATGYDAGRPLPRPTTARPGTPEKVQVLSDRLAAGEQLWHPDDAQGVGSPRPHPRTGKKGRGGIYPYKGKWRVLVWDRREGKLRHVGIFDTQAEARAAALQARKKYGLE